VVAIGRWMKGEETLITPRPRWNALR